MPGVQEVRGVALHRAAQPPQRRQQIAREVARVRQHRVERRDRVPLRQHEAVALGPVRLVRAVAHLAEEKRLHDVHRRQRSARVAAGRRGDRRQVVDAQVEGAVLERGQGLVIVRHCGGAVFPTTVGPSSEKRVSDSIAAQNSRPTPIGSVCAVPVRCVDGAIGGSCAPTRMADDAPGHPPRSRNRARPPRRPRRRLPGPGARLGGGVRRPRDVGLLRPGDPLRPGGRPGARVRAGGRRGVRVRRPRPPGSRAPLPEGRWRASPPPARRSARASA